MFTLTCLSCHKLVDERQMFHLHAGSAEKGKYRGSSICKDCLKDVPGFDEGDIGNELRLAAEARVARL